MAAASRWRRRPSRRGRPRPADADHRRAAHHAGVGGRDPRAGRAHRARAHHGRAPRGARRLDRRGAAASAARRGLDLREPDPVRPPRRLRALPAHARGGRGPLRGGGGGRDLRPEPGGDVPGRLPDRRGSGGADRAAVREGTARALPRGHHGGDEALPRRPPAPRRLRREGLAAARRRAADDGGPGLRHRDPGRAHGARGGRARALEPQPASRPRGPGGRALRAARARCRGRDGGDGRDATSHDRRTGEDGDRGRAAGTARVRGAARSGDAGGGGGGDGAGAARRGRVGGRGAADRQSTARAGGGRPRERAQRASTGRAPGIIWRTGPMMRKMLRAKVHRATVTQANVDYEGSITIDRRLMDATDLLPNEAVCVWNVTNGNRFETYAVEGAPGSGVVCVNGAAAHLVRPGDLVIIAAFTWMEEATARVHEPKVVFVDERNGIREKRAEVAMVRPTSATSPSTGGPFTTTRSPSASRRASPSSAARSSRCATIART